MGKFIPFALVGLPALDPPLAGVEHLEPCLDPCLELCLELSLLALKCLALDSSRWICLARCNWGLAGALFNRGESGGMGEPRHLDVLSFECPPSEVKSCLGMADAAVLDDIAASGIFIQNSPTWRP